MPEKYADSGDSGFGLPVEAVAHPTHRGDGVGAELPAQVADVHVHDVGAGVEVHAPHVVEQLLAGEHLPGVHHEHLGQRELAGRELHLPLTDVGTPAAYVEPDPAALQHVVARAYAVGLPQPQPDPGQQLREAERLGHVVVRAALESGHRVADGVARSEHDDRDLGALRTQSLEHLEAVETGQPDVEHDQVEGAAEGVVEPTVAVSDGRRQVAVGAQPLGDEGGDPLLVLHDQDAGHSSSGVFVLGNVITNRAPGGPASSTNTVPPCALATAPTMESPRPKPSSPGGTAERPKRSKISSRSSGGTPGPVSRTHRRASLAVAEEPMATVSPSWVCLTALSASWSTAWVSRCWSATILTSALPSTTQSRFPSPRALASRSRVRPPRSTGCFCRKSGRSLFASGMRSPTRRDIRSISSSRSRRVSATSSGLPVSRSSRCPRSTVSGVFSSWPASSRNWRWPTNADSSRSSIPLKVRVSAVMSSLPVTGRRRERSVSVISSAVSRRVRRGARSRPDWNAAKPVISSRASAETIA